MGGNFKFQAQDSVLEYFFWEIWKTNLTFWKKKHIFFTGSIYFFQWNCALWEIYLVFAISKLQCLMNRYSKTSVHQNKNALSKTVSPHYESYLNKCKKVLKTILDSLKLVTRLKRRIEVIKNEIKASWRGHFLSYLQSQRALACRPAHSGPLHQILFRNWKQRGSINLWNHTKYTYTKKNVIKTCRYAKSTLLLFNCGLVLRILFRNSLNLTSIFKEVTYALSM